MTKEERAAAYAKMLYNTGSYAADVATDAFIEGVNWAHDNNVFRSELTHLVSRVNALKSLGCVPDDFDLTKAYKLINS